MINLRFILLAFAWVACIIFLYISAVNSAQFIIPTAMNLPKVDVILINGILAINLIASISSFTGLIISTFNTSLLQRHVEFRRLLIIGVCLFPLANILYFISSNFEFSRFFLVSFVLSIAQSALIAAAISTAWRSP